MPVINATFTGIMRRLRHCISWKKWSQQICDLCEIWGLHSSDDLLPVVASWIHQFTLFLSLVSLSLPTFYWLPDCPFPLPIGYWTLLPSCTPGLYLSPFLLVTFTSPWRWRQQSSVKHWYPTITLCGVTTQKTSTVTWCLCFIWLCLLKLNFSTQCSKIEALPLSTFQNEIERNATCSWVTYEEENQHDILSKTVINKPSSLKGESPTKHLNIPLEFLFLSM
jgi:hypothetical protein